MVNPLIVDPDPEPDIEGDIRNQSNIQNQTQSADLVVKSPPTHPIKPQDVLENIINEKQDGVGTDLSTVTSATTTSPSSTILLGSSTLNPSEKQSHSEKKLGYGSNIDGEQTNHHRSPRHHHNVNANANVNETNGNVDGHEHGQEHDDQFQHPDDRDDEPMPNITWGACFTNTVKGCPIICVAPIILPIAWALHATNQNPVAVFVTCLLGVVPLAAGLGFATEELALRLGEAWGGLLNATFGNVVELLIAILALVKGEIDIVQASMIGSILSNILLVLGMSYFAGGLRFHEQLYAIIGAQMHISLLGLSIAAIVLPAAFHYAYPSTSALVAAARSPTGQPQGEELNILLAMSRGLSFLLLAAYCMFLTFQLYTHAYLFRIPREPQVHPLPGPAPNHGSVFPRPNWVPSMDSSSSSDSSGTGSSRGGSRNGPLRRLRRWSVRSRESGSDPRSDEPISGTGATAAPTVPSPPSSPQMPPTPIPPIPEAPAQPYVLDLERQAKLPPHVRFVPNLTNAESQIIEPVPRKREVPQVKAVFAFGMLLFMTGLAGITAEFLVGSIDGLTTNTNVSREFVGLILLPVIGNSVEHITAVTVSVKDKLNLSMSIAVGSSIQVSLCILPVLVLLGWAIGQPMMLFFDTFETITLVLAVLIVNFAISDGRTNYLEGFCMMMAYLAIALVTWYYDPA